MIIDLVEPTQEAIFAALEAAIGADLPRVFVNVPQDVVPKFALIGAIDSNQDLTVAEQFEQMTVEVQYVYRGDDRRQLIRMMAVGRAAIDQQRLIAQPGIAFSIPRYATGSVGTAASDGVTYAGIQNFTLFAQPS